MTKISKVSVVIPTLNEAGTIGDVIKAVHGELKYPHEIIIVDGNSSDGTKEIVKKMNCSLVVEPRRGYGAALIAGIKKAKGDIIVIVDGDGTYEISHINALLEALIREKADLCLGSRMKGLYENSMDLMNFVGNKILTLIFNLFYGQRLTDTQSGFRAFLRSAIEKVELKENGMAFATEMLVKFVNKGFKIVEVPTIYKPRKYGKSKLKRVKEALEIVKILLEGLKPNV